MPQKQLSGDRLSSMSIQDNISDHITLVAILAANGETKIGQFENQIKNNREETLYYCSYPDPDNPEEYEILDWYSAFEIQFFDTELEESKKFTYSEEIKTIGIGSYITVKIKEEEEE